VSYFIGPSNPLLESGPSTVIGGVVSDSKSLNARLNRAQNRHSTSKSDRVLLDAFSLISQFAERSSLSQRVVDRAQELFKMYFDQLTLNPRGGRTRYLKEHETTAVAAASLQWAAHIEGVPRSFKEMTSTTQVPKKTLSDTYLKMKQSLKLNQLNKSTEDFIGRFCSHLRLPHFYTAKAIQIVQACREVDGVYGRSYITVAAAAIYTACERFGTDELKRMIRRHLPKVSGVEIVTIANTFRIMKPHADKLFKSLPSDGVHSR
jgi:transcription initiation factor TFIIB